MFIELRPSLFGGKITQIFNSVTRFDYIMVICNKYNIQCDYVYDSLGEKRAGGDSLRTFNKNVKNGGNNDKARFHKYLKQIPF